MGGRASVAVRRRSADHDSEEHERSDRVVHRRPWNSKTSIRDVLAACDLPRGARGREGFFDDGKIAGVVRARRNQTLEIEVTDARPEGSELRSNKGINFPDSKLTLSSITDKDWRT